MEKEKINFVIYCNFGLNPINKEINSYGIYIKSNCPYILKSHYLSYNGEKAEEKFVRCLMSTREKITTCCRRKREDIKIIPVFIKNETKLNLNFIDSLIYIFNKEIKGVNNVEIISNKPKLQIFDTFSFFEFDLLKSIIFLKEFPILESQFTKSDLIKKSFYYPSEYVDFKATFLPPNYPQDSYNIWNEYNCSTMGDYHDIFLKRDVIIFTDIIENFRNFFLERYESDPCNCLYSPTLMCHLFRKFLIINKYKQEMII